MNYKEMNSKEMNYKGMNYKRLSYKERKFPSYLTYLGTTDTSWPRPA